MSEPGQPKDLRASDHDREHVAEQLRVAAGDGRLDFDELDERLGAAYRAKTYGELEPLVSDLPGARRSPVRREVAPQGGQHPTMPVGGRSFSGPAIAIFGAATRKGSWVVPRRFQAFAVFGGVEIDLRDATLEDREVTIMANAILAGAAPCAEARYGRRSILRRRPSPHHRRSRRSRRPERATGRSPAAVTAQRAVAKSTLAYACSFSIWCQLSMARIVPLFERMTSECVRATPAL